MHMMNNNQIEVKESPYGARYWDKVAKDINKLGLSKVMDEYTCSEIKKLIDRWVNGHDKRIVLKTDLFELAYRRPCWEFYNEIGNVIGIDISFLIAKKAKGKTNSLKCVVSDICNLSFKDGSFDLIISHSTLDHLSVHSVSAALIELNRVLKEDGILIITLDNKHNFLKNLIFDLTKRGFLRSRSRYHTEKFYSIKEALNLLNDARLDVIEYAAVCPKLPFLTTILNITARLYNRDNNFLNDQIIKILDTIGKRKKISLYTSAFIAFKCQKQLKGQQ